MAKQKGSKKRSLLVVNEHFEPLFNADSAASGINQSFLKVNPTLKIQTYPKAPKLRTLRQEN